MPFGAAGIDTNQEAGAAFASAAADFGVPNAGQFNAQGQIMAVIARLLPGSVLAPLPTGNATADRIALQTAITRALGRTLLLPPGYNYTIDEDLVIAGALYLLGYRTTITQVTTGQSGLTVQASDVTIEGLTLDGPQYAALDLGERGINVVAPSWAAKYERVYVRNCRITGWGHAAVYFKWVSDFEVVHSRLGECYYAGFLGLSVTDGAVDDNRIWDIPGDPNAYGISFNRDEQDSLVTDPRSANCTACRNRIRDIPVWNGVDTHGGEDITMADNILVNVARPCWAVASDGAGNIETFAPKRVIIANNVASSGVTDGSAGAAFVISGAASGVGAVVDYAVGCQIVNNTAEGYGNGNAGQGGVVVEFAIGYKVHGNLLIEPSPDGVVLASDALGGSVTDNDVVDAWDDVNFGRAVRVQNDNVTAHIAGNALIRGTKTALHVNDEGLLVLTGAANVALTLGPNDWSGATTAGTVRDQVGGSLTNVRTVLATHAVVASDDIVLCDATAGAFDVDLPDAAAAAGRILTIKKIDASGNAVTIDPSGAQLIDGAANLPLAAQWDGARIASNGSAWYVLGIGP